MGLLIVRGCRNCGHVGLPRNAEQCTDKGSVPAGQCSQCGQAEQTNFVCITTPDKDKTLPWIELQSDKPVGQVKLQEPGKIGEKAAKVKPNDPCPCGNGKKAKKCCHNAANK